MEKCRIIGYYVYSSLTEDKSELAAIKLEAFLLLFDLWELSLTFRHSRLKNGGRRLKIEASRLKKRG
jgi:hypothetical protein